MSKYIKLESLKWHSPDESIAKPLTEFYITESDIADLPTIEVSEDCDTCIWNSCNYNKVPWEVSEDCISREWVKGICEAMLDEEMLGHMLGYIEDAPSVVPSRAEGEWRYESEIVCEKCGYEIPRIEKLVGETVLMDSKDWDYCPNCGAKMKGADDENMDVL